MVLKNLFRKKLRTAFSVVGVGVGISLMVAMFTLSNDLLAQILALIENERGDIIGIQSGRNLVSSEIELKTTGPSGDLLAEIRTDKNVKLAEPMVWSYMTTEKKVGPASQLDYYGVTEKSPAIRSFKAIAHVKPGAPLIDDSDPNGLIVGKRLLDLVNSKLPADRQIGVGQRMDMAQLLLEELSEYFVEQGGKPWREMSAIEQAAFAKRRLKAAGINPLAASSLRDLYVRAVFTAPQPLMEAAIFFPLIRAQQLKGMEGKATVVMVELHDTSDRAKVETVTRLEQRFEHVKFARADEVEQEYAEYIGMFKDITWGISIIAALAGALGVLNIMVLAVHERTSEIGLLLAIGWSRARVLRSVLYEGVLITLMGGVFGILLGLVEMAAVKKYLNLIMLEPRVDLQIAGFTMALALVLGLVASLYPAWRASRLTPMDALRRE